MSAAIKFHPERRQHIQCLITELQQQRQELWSLYCQIGRLKPFDDHAALKPILKQFAEIIVDYVSLGHFGIYDRLLAGCERRARLLTDAQNIYPEFSKTTDAVITFNDRYDQGKRKFTVDKLEADLSKLGESLAYRMEIEDRLCGMLLS
ncbi:Rsd/AlgQ family anti-sigma factor [Methylomarinum sp. Ch1-1]|uniref:Rsd/AlgQ family anti-sigma factor n=1 Tax=Methylomarinum roseum TaxID=3067653 RepID=A0AAU7NXK0_9GAMM|nr:Rsd/AlgQ family anti-sigma factor [Methylomarinum sp. Ch1-1]MDP4522188.1 Rsd/AlgQ family anti-sigma factor [Methylomarinum sp. Ch1-1]